MAKIGFIGTGIMGKPMAQNLQNAGHTLFFSEHFDKAPADLLGNNGIGLANPREVAQEAEFIIIMVPDTPQVEDVLFRADGVAAGLSPNKVVIDMSSISPTATKAFAASASVSPPQCGHWPCNTARVSVIVQASGLSSMKPRTPSGSASTGKKIGLKNISALIAIPSTWPTSRT